MSHRAGEEDKVHFRSERIVAVNGEWFLAVRDVPNLLGPFSSKAKAERALAMFLGDLEANYTPAQALTHLRLSKDFYSEDDF